jgi:hypothetical protein
MASGSAVASLRSDGRSKLTDIRVACRRRRWIVDARARYKSWKKGRYLMKQIKIVKSAVRIRQRAAGLLL